LGQQTLGTLQEQNFEQGKQLVMIDQCAHEWHQTLLLYFRMLQKYTDSILREFKDHTAAQAGCWSNSS
jgi:hypothetical protein